MVTKHHIFKYVNEFLSKQPSLQVKAGTYRFTDENYNDFITYLKDKDYSYKTESDFALEELKDDATKEKYYESIKNEYESLKAKMANNKKDDLMRFKNEIQQFIEEEIVSRYEFQTGRVETNLKYDEEVNVAKKILADATKLKSILTTVEKPNKPFNANKKF